MKKGFLGIGLILSCVIIYLLVRTLTFSSVQEQFPQIEKIVVRPEAKLNLSDAIKLKTISHMDKTQMDSLPFFEFLELVKTKYPLVTAQLDCKIFNELGLLYKWEGTSNAAPLILMGHYDVVPIPEENLPQWKEDPFSGLIEDGIIWGRGAIDDKIAVIGILEAAEALLKVGFRPKQTIYFSFGHDEEVGGHNGAEAIAAYLKSQGVKAGMVLDEGYALTEDLIPGVSEPVALIGTAEKGYASIKMTVEIEGGHSSVPAAETAIGLLAGAIQELQENQFSPSTTAPMKDFMRRIGPEMSFTSKMAMANQVVFKSMIYSIYSESAEGNALIRTTTAPTVFNAGLKDNVIPGGANCILNFRLLPGDDEAKVLSHVKEVLDDDRIEIEVLSYNPASPESPTDVAEFEVLNRTIKELYNNPHTSPNLVLGATDARYFYSICDNVYRFLPIRLTPELVPMFHGINERIPVDEFEDGIRFYTRLIQNIDNMQ
ncbi:MAG: carboxypeptidase PM20D1 [Limisphaerales bacterium]|jgi:carboxypeptidase PM20D1